MTASRKVRYRGATGLNGDSGPVSFVRIIQPKVRLVRAADLHPPKMPYDEGMAGLVKLHRSAQTGSER